MRIDAALGRDSRDRAVHQAAVDEWKSERLGDALTDSRFT